ncbi:MAG: Y-family DNA polymerase [Bacteroidales bacterium]|nr:Y-family DNA polymerase [Bacteroidales bacterium]
MFALVDCNNFYVSCELVFRPDLRGKVVVVLSNNDGCVISRSNEAKKLGIPMGVPFFEIKPLLDLHNGTYFSSNFMLYGDMSRRVMTLLQEFAPAIEIYSIDEAFLDFRGFSPEPSLREYGLKIKKYIYQCTGIPISIGIAPTKALAKVANKIAKTFPEKTQGVYAIDDERKREKALKWLPVEDVWGIGSRWSARFHKIGIKTAYDFTQLSDEWVRKRMTIVGLRLKKELMGESCFELEENLNVRSSISVSRSFYEELTTFNEVYERIATFVSRGAFKLRKQNSVAGMLMVYLRSNPFKNNEKIFFRQGLARLSHRTDSTIELLHYAKSVLQKIYEPHPIKKAGIILMDLVSSEARELSFFHEYLAKHEQLMHVLDKVNEKYGFDTLRIAAQQAPLRHKVLQQKLSPSYTTRWEDILVVKAK